LRAGYEIVVLDNFSSGRIENIKPHIKGNNFHLIKGDVRSPEDVGKVIKGVDIVCHLAAIVNVPLSVENPLLVEDVNVKGTLNLLEACVKHGVQRFLYISTCAVYGEAIYLPIDEEHPTNPLSPYGASKLAAENYCKVFQRIHSLQTVCLRFFNVYGPRQSGGPYSGVITAFLKSLEKQEPLLIYGDGNQTRDFLYVADAAKACMIALHCKNCSGKTFNIGTGKRTSISELAEILIELVGKGKANVFHKPERKGDIRESYANLSRAEKELGFKPEFSIYKGLKKLIRGINHCS
jgi:UDP-glucose 4-epimerase